MHNAHSGTFHTIKIDKEGRTQTKLFFSIHAVYTTPIVFSIGWTIHCWCVNWYALSTCIGRGTPVSHKIQMFIWHFWQKVTFKTVGWNGTAQLFYCYLRLSRYARCASYLFEAWRLLDLHHHGQRNCLWQSTKKGLQRWTLKIEIFRKLTGTRSDFSGRFISFLLLFIIICLSIVDVDDMNFDNDTILISLTTEKRKIIRVGLWMVPCLE